MTSRVGAALALCLLRRIRRAIPHRTVGTAALAVSISVAAMEGVLSISLRGGSGPPKPASTEPSPTVRTGSGPVTSTEPAPLPFSQSTMSNLSSPKLTHVPQSVEQVPNAPGQEAAENPCEIDYVALLTLDEGPACVRNPTQQMPHWGPPSTAWFRRSDGAFKLEADDFLSDDQCRCLNKQPAYQTNRTAYSFSPIMVATYKDREVSIEKWVCGDPCIGNAE